MKIGAPIAEMFAVITFVGGKIQSLLKECSLQVACGQSCSCLAENLFNEPKLYWLFDRTPGWISHDHEASNP